MNNPDQEAAQTLKVLLTKLLSQKDIDSFHSMKAIQNDIEWAVVDTMPTANAMAQFEPKPDGKAKITVLRSSVEQGDWAFYNAVIHEMVHTVQYNNPQLKAFFQLHPNTEQSATINFLMECDAYVKTQSIMRDLEEKAFVSAPETPSNEFSRQVAGLYQQIEGAGYSHDEGAAQQILFRSLVFGNGGNFCASYVFPRLEQEIAQLADLQAVVAEKGITQGGLTVANIYSGDSAEVDIARCLGTIKNSNFMADDDGKLDYLTKPDFLETAMPNQHEYFKEFCAEHARNMEALSPYLAGHNPDAAGKLIKQFVVSASPSP